jgi:hypothetical protein
LDSEEWIKRGCEVELDYVEGKDEDPDQLSVVFVKSRGLKRFEQKRKLKFTVEYILDEHGHPLAVTGPNGNDSYQFHFVPDPAGPVEEPNHSGER